MRGGESARSSLRSLFAATRCVGVRQLVAIYLLRFVGNTLRSLLLCLAGLFAALLLRFDAERANADPAKAEYGKFSKVRPLPSLTSFFHADFLLNFVRRNDSRLPLLATLHLITSVRVINSVDPSDIFV